MKTRSVELKTVELSSEIFSPIIFDLETYYWPVVLYNCFIVDDPWRSNLSLSSFSVELVSLTYGEKLNQLASLGRGYLDVCNKTMENNN